VDSYIYIIKSPRHIYIALDFLFPLITVYNYVDKCAHNTEDKRGIMVEFINQINS